MNTYRRIFPSAGYAVPEAREAVFEFAKRCGFSPDDAYDIRLAAGEACTNAIEHGHVPQGSFTVTCCYDVDNLVVNVDDQGGSLPFESKTWDRIIPKKSGVGGLGLFVMRQLMDDVQIQAVEGDGMRVTFCKQRLPAYSKQNVHIR